MARIPISARRFTSDLGGQPGFRLLQGKELSYTNLLDLDAAARIVMEFDEPAAVVIKHTNPCGAATGSGAADAYIRARDADSLAAFGGIVGLNRPIDVDAARAIVSTFIEAVSAPSVDDKAQAILATKPNMRVVIPDAVPLRQLRLPTRSSRCARLLAAFSCRLATWSARHTCPGLRRRA